MDLRHLLIISCGGNVGLMVLLAITHWSAAQRATSQFTSNPLPAAGAELPENGRPSHEAARTPDIVEPTIPDLNRTGERGAEGPHNFQDFLMELEALDLRIVPRRLLERLEIPALDSDAQITEAIRELLALGEEEVERLNHLFRDTADRLRELELKNIEIGPLSEGQVKVRISPMGPDRDRLRDTLQDALHRELGDIDGPLLWDILNEKSNLDFWSDFGKQGVEITITHGPDDSGKVAFTVEREPLSGKRWSRKNISYPSSPEETVKNLEEALERQSYLIEYLPDVIEASDDPGN